MKMKLFLMLLSISIIAVPCSAQNDPFGGEPFEPKTSQDQNDPFGVPRLPETKKPPQRGTASEPTNPSVDPFEPWRSNPNRMEEASGGGMYGSAGAGMDSGSEGDYGMGFSAEGYGEAAPSSAELFQRGLAMSIKMLREAKTDAEKQRIQKMVQKAFEERYEAMLQLREKQQSELEARVKQLQEKLSRQRAAKKRVVDLQMQSVELAAEGLLQLDGVGPQPNNDLFGS